MMRPGRTGHDQVVPFFGAAQVVRDAAAEILEDLDLEEKNH